MTAEIKECPGLWTNTSTQCVPDLGGVRCYNLSYQLNMVLNPFSYTDLTEAASVMNKILHQWFLQDSTMFTRCHTAGQKV